MTRFLFLLATFLSVATGISASTPDDDGEVVDVPQKGKSTEVCVGYGALPAMRFIPAYYNHWQRMNPWGAVTISLDHRFAPRLWLGVAYSISSASTSGACVRGDAAITWHSMMVHGRYHYWQRGDISLYAMVGGGVTSTFLQPSWGPTSRLTQVAFQISPVCVNWQALDNLDLFAETGFGVVGAFRGGFRIDF